MFSKKKNSKTTNYGTNTNDNTRNLEDSSSEEIISLSDHTSYWYAGPRKTTFDIEEDMDVEDFGNWNPESIPLLQRTIDQARSLGVKRTISWMAGTHTMQELPEDDQEQENKPWHWSRKFKVFMLTVVCIIVTVLLLFLPEETKNFEIVTVDRNLDYVVDIDEIYNYQSFSSSQIILEVTLEGSFIAYEFTSLAPRKLNVHLNLDDNNTKLDAFTVGMYPHSTPIRGSSTLKQTQIQTSFSLTGIDLATQNVTLKFFTGSDEPIAVSVKTQLLSERINEGIIYGSVILVVMYFCISLELAHRTVIAMVAATSSIATLATLNERPTLEDIMTWLDIETLVLLFSMMIIVSILSETGAFNFMGFWAFKITKGKTWPLIGALCTITAVVSAFLDNVTTMLLMTPVALQLTESINIDPVPVLIAMVIFSNIGGAATAIGDPPNVLIASDLDLINGGITFLNFSLHMSICVIINAIFCALYLLFALRNINQKKEDKELHELRHEIIIWNKMQRSLPSHSRQEYLVKEIIGAKIEELRDEYEHILSEKRKYLLNSGDNHNSSIHSLEESCKITNKDLLVKAAVVLVIVVLLFFLQNIPSLNLSLGWVALLGAISLLVLSDKSEVESVFARVEWATLVFFAALFVLMEALAQLGLLNAIGSAVEYVILQVAPENRLTVAILIILWISGIASAFIDNIPYTTMMIPVVKGIAQNPALNLPLQPLVWSLALGACFGGNGTLIGASANVVCAGVAEQHGYKFSFMDFFKIGFPITIISLLVASGYLMLCHVVFQWNY